MQPFPETIDILADIQESRTRHRVSGFPTVIRDLARFAGAGTDRGLGPTPRDERQALIQLAAHAVSRIEYLDEKVIK